MAEKVHRYSKGTRVDRPARLEGLSTEGVAADKEVTAIAAPVGFYAGKAVG